MLQRYCAQCKNESSRTTSVKCVYFQTFLQISWGIVWGIVYFKFYPRGFSFSTFDYRYFKLITIFNGKHKLLEPQKCPHNPEAVGSSPASATTNKTAACFLQTAVFSWLSWFRRCSVRIIVAQNICFLHRLIPAVRPIPALRRSRPAKHR